MKLTTVTHVSVDGVMQGLGGPEEDCRGGFERGGWALPLFASDNEAARYVNQVYQRASAFLFGRRTYEIFAGSWGAIPEMIASPIGAALNSRPKYVASTTLTDPWWADTTVLSGDVAGLADPADRWHRPAAAAFPGLRLARRAHVPHTGPDVARAQHVRTHPVQAAVEGEHLA